MVKSLNNSINAKHLKNDQNFKNGKTTGEERKMKNERRFQHKRIRYNKLSSECISYCLKFRNVSLIRTF